MFLCNRELSQLRTCMAMYNDIHTYYIFFAGREGKIHLGLMGRFCQRCNQLGLPSLAVVTETALFILFTVHPGSSENATLPLTITDKTVNKEMKQTGGKSFESVACCRISSAN